MPFENDIIAAAWKNDLAFLRIVCELSGLAAALWRPGMSAAAEPVFRWTGSPSGEHPCLCDAALRTALEAYC